MLFKDISVLLLGVALSAAIIGLDIAADMVVNDYKEYQRESACVAKYIAVGIERKDIITSNGTCAVKEL